MHVCCTKLKEKLDVEKRWLARLLSSWTMYPNQNIPCQEQGIVLINSSIYSVGFHTWASYINFHKHINLIWVWKLEFSIKLKAVGELFDQISHSVNSNECIWTRLPVIMKWFQTTHRDVNMCSTCTWVPLLLTNICCICHIIKFSAE